MDIGFTKNSSNYTAGNFAGYPRSQQLIMVGEYDLNNMTMMVSSPPIPYEPDDYFECKVFQDSRRTINIFGNNPTVNSGNTFAVMEILS